MTTEFLRPLAGRFKALAHPVRLRMIALLQDGPLCVCQMMDVVQLAASTTSEHLSELRRVGLLREQKEGRWVRVSLSEDLSTQAFLASFWPILDADPQVQQDRIRSAQVRQIPLATVCSQRVSEPSLLDHKVSHDPSN